MERTHCMENKNPRGRRDLQLVLGSIEVDSSGQNVGNCIGTIGYDGIGCGSNGNARDVETSALCRDTWSRGQEGDQVESRDIEANWDR